MASGTMMNNKISELGWVGVWGVGPTDFQHESGRPGRGASLVGSRSRPRAVPQGPTFSIWYDYRLYNDLGRQLRLQARGERKYLTFNFTKAGGGATRLAVHRVYAMNTPRCNVQPLC